MMWIIGAPERLVAWMSRTTFHWPAAWLERNPRRDKATAVLVGFVALILIAWGIALAVPDPAFYLGAAAASLFFGILLAVAHVQNGRYSTDEK